MLNIALFQVCRQFLRLPMGRAIMDHQSIAELSAGFSQGTAHSNSASRYQCGFTSAAGLRFCH
jgi:hypothetical protein